MEESGVWEFWSSPSGIAPEGDGERELLPWYDNSLDAMHEAEKRLTAEDWDVYCRILEHKCRKKYEPNLDTIWRDMNPSWVIDACLIHAKADVRAEAFVETLDEKDERAKRDVLNMLKEFRQALIDGKASLDADKLEGLTPEIKERMVLIAARNYRVQQNKKYDTKRQG